MKEPHRYIQTDIKAVFLQPRRRVTTVYRVTEPLPCVGCGVVMQVGDLLTRHEHGRNEERQYLQRFQPANKPYCRVCWPFEIIEETKLSVESFYRERLL